MAPRVTSRLEAPPTFTDWLRSTAAPSIATWRAHHRGRPPACALRMTAPLAAAQRPPPGHCPTICYAIASGFQSLEYVLRGSQELHELVRCAADLVLVVVPAELLLHRLLELLPNLLHHVLRSSAPRQVGLDSDGHE